MTDAAIIAVCSICGACIAALLIVSLLLYAAKGDVGDARVQAETATGELAIAKATIATLTDSLTAERTRANALDDELAKTETAPDPAAARGIVLARWRAARTTAVTPAGGAPSAVPAKPAAAVARP